MTLIRIKVPVSGDQFAWRPGELVDLPAVDAAKWADGERAEYVDESDGDGTADVPDDEPPPAPPAGNASRDEWVAYALSLGATEEEIADLKRDDLRARYGAPSTDTEA